MKIPKKIILIGITVVILIGGLGMYKFNYLASKNSHDVDGNKITKTEEGKKDKETNNKKELKIFLTVMDGSELIKSVEGETFGCEDKLLPVVVGTDLSPKETLEKLLSYIDEEQNLYNVFANESTTISVDSLETVDRKAIVKLSGTGLCGGVCDVPRITAQLNATLLQFEDINKVEAFFNGKIFEGYLSEKDDENNGSQLISPQEFKERLDTGEYILVDIRTTEEYENESILGTDLVLDFYKDDFSEQVSNLDKDKKYLYYCRTGNRTGHTSELAEKFNFAEAYELDGGIVDWKKAGYETEKVE